MEGIRLAKNADLQGLMTLFEEVKTGLQAIGLDQWPAHYPAESTVFTDLKRAEVYCESSDGRLIGTLTLNTEQDEAYESIEWAIPAQLPFVIHRLVVHPSCWGQGFGKKWMQFAESQARKRGGQVMRLDTYEKNNASNALYEKLGYQRAKGKCYFYGPEKRFICYEKQL